jgi:hypothetical protein
MDKSLLIFKSPITHDLPGIESTARSPGYRPTRLQHQKQIRDGLAKPHVSSLDPIVRVVEADPVFLIHLREEIGWKAQPQDSNLWPEVLWLLQNKPICGPN